MRSALVTGSAGFIGYHLCRQLLNSGWRVTGFDGLTDYYEVTLKKSRHKQLSAYMWFSAYEDLLETPGAVLKAAEAAEPDVIIHLAAQAGVRYSIENPRAYLDSNVIGSFNVMEAALALDVDHLLMASTSSVYGANTQMPYREIDKADTQMSFYAATKKAGEAMSHAWAHIHGLPVTQFRFFTVYGPWGRPDMALFKFTKAILAGEPIDLYNRGEMVRDFTYVDDLVAGIVSLIDKVPPGPDSRPDTGVPADSLSPVAPFRVVNIGNSQKVPLMEFVAAIEAATGRVAEKNLMPMQAGDVPATWADTALLRALTGAAPATPVAEGVARFVEWYRSYYSV